MAGFDLLKPLTTQPKGWTTAEVEDYNRNIWLIEAALKSVGAVITPSGTTGPPTVSIPLPDHGDLTGLGDDDHTQYALLLGRTGGQTIIGGNSTSLEQLILKPNSITTIPTVLTVGNGTLGVEVRGDYSFTGSARTLTARSASVGAFSAASVFRAENAAGTPVFEVSVLGSSPNIISFHNGALLVLADGSMPDNLFKLSDNSDPTKFLVFQLSGISPSTTRTLTIPNASGTIALTSDFPTTTKGDLLVHNGTNNVRLPVGTDGQVLVADSADSEGLKWGDVTGSEWTTIKKTADETITTDTTLSDDSELTFPVAASTNYSFKFRIFFTTGATEDFKYDITGPAGITKLVLSRKSIAPGAIALGSIGVDTAFSGAVAIAGGSGSGYLEIEGILQNGGSSGNVTFRWAQNTSGGNDTIVHAGSYVEYMEV